MFRERSPHGLGVDGEVGEQAASEDRAYGEGVLRQSHP